MRAQRAKLAMDAGRSEAQERMAIVDPAFRPTHPAKGGRTNTALAGVGLAWLLAIAYVAARASLDDTIVEALDVEMLARATLLGVVPKLEPLGPSPAGGKATEDAAA
jgi:capsular polysaccharide biosynthesis protein